MARVENKKIKAKNYSRRDFLVGGGAVIAVDAFSASAPAAAALTESASPVAAGTSYAESKGYLVYDSKKCAGCVTCMLACSLVHEGRRESVAVADTDCAELFCQISRRHQDGGLPAMRHTRMRPELSDRRVFCRQRQRQCQKDRQRQVHRLQDMPLRVSAATEPDGLESHHKKVHEVRPVHRFSLLE